MTSPKTRLPPPDLLDRINAYCEKHDLSVSMVMERAKTSQIRASNLVDGSRFHVNTLERIEAFLKGDPDDPPPIKRSKPTVIYGRDPCIKCGVRGDIGCEHQPANAGRSLYV